MSTYYATFETLPEGRVAVEHLLREGIPPENISLVGEVQATPEEQKLMASGGKLGDASFFVGRADDPNPDLDADVRRLVGRVPNSEYNQIGGIDTSNIDL